MSECRHGPSPVDIRPSCPDCRAERDQIADVHARVSALREHIDALNGPILTASTRRRLAFHRGRLAALDQLWRSIPWLLQRLLKSHVMRGLDETESGLAMAMLLESETTWCPLHDVVRAAFDIRCKCNGGDR